MVWGHLLREELSSYFASFFILFQTSLPHFPLTLKLWMGRPSYSSLRSKLCYYQFGGRLETSNPLPASVKGKVCKIVQELDAGSQLVHVIMMVII